MRPIVLFVLLAVLFNAACDRLDATRNFNNGVRYFEREEYAAAAKMFELARNARDEPEIRYNLAIARWAVLRDTPTSSTSAATADDRPEVEEALSAVHSALDVATTKASEAALHYIEGAIHRGSGDPAAARAAFGRALTAEKRYPPALKAMIELSPQSDALTTQLLLTSITVEEPSLVRKLELQ